MTTIVWFRQDLRLADNPALHAALAADAAIVPVFIHAPHEEGAWAPGGAACWWLHHSLDSLARDLDLCGSRLILRAGGDSLALLQDIVRTCGADRVVWNRCYTPAAIARDQRVKAGLRAQGVAAQSYNSLLLREPWEVATRTGGPFQVFTPFWRHCLSLAEPPDPLPPPQALPAPARWPISQPLERLALLPTHDWAQGLRQTWAPGSGSAHVRLGHFLREGFVQYPAQRNRPDLEGTSRLSPHLHFGEIGPREIWRATRVFAGSVGDQTAWRQSQFMSEIGWREFAHHLLYHFPHTPERPLRPGYERFPWNDNPPALAAWQRGRTGYPIVDAGLRELWSSGWMHNRVRMIAGSFLVKDLLLPWAEGARWFWDTLVDADLASNTLGWQWTAGCGADAAPFFRIFNPILQGAKFDPHGSYVRRWVPELAGLPTDWVHWPAGAPAAVLRAAGVQLGGNYPHPLVDHVVARQAALAALATLKK